MPPFQCSSDGTIFFNMIEPSTIADAADYSRLPLTALDRSNRIVTFQIRQIDGLFDVRESSHYASESAVVFLVSAAQENQPASQKYASDFGAISEEATNSAPRHNFAAIFDLAAKFKNLVQLDDAFQVQRLGVFPSGLFLAYGYDATDHATRIALLNSDGTILKYLTAEDGALPKTAFHKASIGNTKVDFVNPVQFVPFGTSILMVQNKARFPLLEVSEAGAVRVIRPKLPGGLQIETLIPSDVNLFARVNEGENGSIYELNPRTGAALKRFQLEKSEGSHNVSCVREGKFLSFEHATGALVPLLGTPKRAADGNPEKGHRQREMHSSAGLN